MNKVFAIAIILTLLVACQKMEKINPFEKKEKDNEKENACAIVNAEQIPSVVLSSLQAKYPGVTVDKWFNKDNIGFCGLFTFNGNKTISQFNNDGSFVIEEIDNDHGDNHQSNHESNGCECEIQK